MNDKDSILNRRFTTSQIAEDLKINGGTIHLYIKAGAIKPDINESSGTGTRRVYSLHNYFELSLITMLIRRYGIPQRHIVKLFQTINAAHERGLLDPARFLADNRKHEEYLLFFGIDGDGEASYRFIIDANEKIKVTRREFKAAKKMTSYQKPQHIRDHLLDTPSCVVVNLDYAAHLFLLGT